MLKSICLQALVKFCGIILKRQEKDETESADQKPAQDTEGEEKKEDSEEEKGEMNVLS